MFGIVAIIICFVCWMVRSGRETSLNNTLKSQSQDAFLWTDVNGVSRLKSNNKIAVAYASANGHTYIRDKDGNILFDATERLTQIEAAKNPVDYIIETLKGYPIRVYEKANRNGNMQRYTMIHFRDADLIVNLDRMKVERPTDDQLRFELDCKAKGYRSYSEEGFRNMIRDFNLKSEFDRQSIIGECNIQNCKPNTGTYWCNTIYNHRLPNRNNASDLDRRWIR